MTSRQRSWLLPPAVLTLIAGILIGRDTLEHNVVANLLLKINVLTIGVGI